MSILPGYLFLERLTRPAGSGGGPVQPVNVLLVTHRDENQHLILPQVLREVETLGGGHRLRLVRDSGKRLRRFLIWQLYHTLHRLWTLGQPTVVISMRRALAVPYRKFAPRWATIWQQLPMDKIQEFTVLDEAGIPIPRWAAVRRDYQPDLSAFGEFVVVKPADGAKGAFVRVMRRSRVSWRPFQVKWRPLYAGTDLSETVSEALVVQDYIHTGPWPICYRVGTVFGEPIYAWRVTADRSRKAFDPSLEGSRFFDGRTIVAPSTGSTLDTEVPNDILDFARRAHTAFPNVPCLGVDIVREESTGKLYALEVHVSGGTFHLTSPMRDRLSDTEIDLDAQFGGAAAVARGIHGRVSAHLEQLSSSTSAGNKTGEDRPVRNA